MCGIVGCIEKRDAYPVLIQSLKRLEYRGYDSAGVALIDKKRRLNVYKTKGKAFKSESFVFQKDISATIGIAHTCWATHGEPCQANAYPHFSSSENSVLIHNGIIENYSTLKEKLQKKGFIFKSSADTEVLVQLIESFQVSGHLSLFTAIRLLKEKHLEAIRELTLIPAKIKKILISNPKIAELSRTFIYVHNCLSDRTEKLSIEFPETVSRVCKNCQ